MCNNISNDKLLLLICVLMCNEIMCSNINDNINNINVCM